MISLKIIEGSLKNVFEDDIDKCLRFSLGLNLLVTYNEEWHAVWCSCCLPLLGPEITIWIFLTIDSFKMTSITSGQSLAPGILVVSISTGPMGLLPDT